MKDRTVTHGTFVIEKEYTAPVEKTFSAFADAQKKRKWFAEGEGFAIDAFEVDFKVGGKETSRFRFIGGKPEDAMSMGNDSVYMDIIENKRIVVAYTMTINDRRISSSLATVEFLKTDTGSKLIFTEQGAYFEGSDGLEGREKGWHELINQLGDLLSN